MSVARLLVPLLLVPALVRAMEARVPRHPAPSPTGSSVVFSWQGDLWDVAAAGGIARRLTSLESTLAQRDLLRLDVELVPFHPFADRVWSLRNNLTSYDAWYVAVAEALGLGLATLDGRLARATGPVCRFLLPPGSPYGGRSALSSRRTPPPPRRASSPIHSAERA